jgi:hypothetical protein
MTQNIIITPGLYRIEVRWAENGQVGGVTRSSRPLAD